ncbi:hypothetical protein ANAPH2_01435 [Anaplasma phagocytophilum]|nr:hypothetical protein ANAPH2_01435 [Anaplasma phagocytophilum]
MVHAHTNRVYRVLDQKTSGQHMQLLRQSHYPQRITLHTSSYALQICPSLQQSTEHSNRGNNYEPLPTNKPHHRVYDFTKQNTVRKDTF